MLGYILSSRPAEATRKPVYQKNKTTKTILNDIIYTNSTKHPSSIGVKEEKWQWHINKEGWQSLRSDGTNRHIYRSEQIALLQCK